MPQQIEIRNLLPAVFSDEPERTLHAGSDVWLTPSLIFRKGEKTLIRAASGCGKSSLCAFITGMRTDFEGQILFDNTPSQSLSRNQWAELRRQHLSYLPQEMKLFAPLTVMENIRLKNTLTGRFDDKEIMEMLHAVEMADFANRQAGRLSLGQQQRVAFVRALCQPFDFILLDEPVSHLDARANDAQASLLLEVANRYGAGVVVTSVGNDLAIPYDTTLTL